MKEKYIAWIDNYSDGWSPSEEFDTLQEAIDYAFEKNYGSSFKITKLINWKPVEL